MNLYTYVDHGNVPAGQYFEDVVLFECVATTILEADKLCRQAGHNPTLWHVGTRITAAESSDTKEVSWVM